MIQRLYKTALGYMIAGLTAGMFTRVYVDEISHFEGDTQLQILHVHLLAMGMLFFLIVLGLEKLFMLSKSRYFNLFYWSYNIGFIGLIASMVVNGIMQVRGMSESPAVTGIAGLAHIGITAGLVLFFMALGQRLKIEK